MLKRYLALELPNQQSLFLWGARKTGKSTFLKQAYPNALYIDFLKQDVLWRYAKNPALLREELIHNPPQKNQPVIIDEVQKIPEILDEVHWMIENIKGIRFILCGSSLRKLKHQGSNLLGGRAWRQLFFPLCYTELPNFDLLKIFNHGLMPSHYLSSSIPRRSLQGYVMDYLIPEVQFESRIRQLGGFHRFLEAIAFSNGEMVNYSNIARECAVNSRTVQAYVELLIDMLLGYLIFPFHKSKSRQLITSTPKFYFFDIALVNVLQNRTISLLKGPEAGHLFEHYILLELTAYRGLHHQTIDINYWRAKSGLEVDFILNRGSVALECKISTVIRVQDIQGLIAFSEEHAPTISAVICLEPKKRIIKIKKITIVIYPIEMFLEELWAGRIL